MKLRQTPVRMILRRGLRRRCPQCGEGRLFDGWYSLHENCAICGLAFEPLAGNSWWFMYYSTAIMTGVVILAMLLIRPHSLWLGRTVVFVAAMALVLLTLPTRKGLAVAVDYLTELRSGRSDLDIRP
jgi:uncharacterized protein (DUF983 family)